MTRAKALSVTRDFLGHDPTAQLRHARKQLTAETVPQSDEGLRIFAANGDWSATLDLAYALEREAVARNGGSSSSSAAATRARMPYILVQVSALIKMHRVNEAKKLTDTLEGVSELKDNGEGLVPFSLRFLSAIIPFYQEDAKCATRNLYALLAEAKDRTSATAARGLWAARARRVIRALIYIHYHECHFETAISLFQQLIDSNEDGADLPGDGGAAEDASSQRLRCVIQLQQFACMCLQIGKKAQSEMLFEEIKNIAESQRTTELAHIAAMNSAFVEVFKGDFESAAQRFRSIGAQVDAELREAEGERDDAAQSVNNSEAHDVRLCALRDLYAYAESSRATCLPYCRSATQDPTEFLEDMTTSLEASLKSNPFMLSHSDGFIKSIVRLYTLAGDRRKQLDRLAHVLEVFRCDAATLPNLDKMA